MQSNNSGGIGILGVLAIVFIVLKLVGVIHWSWLLVLLPIWISLAGLLVVLGVGVLFIALTR